MQVWIGWVDEGSYSSYTRTIVGVFDNPDAGEHAARALLTEKIAQRQTLANHQQPIASGEQPYVVSKHTTGAGHVYQTEDQWRTHARDFVGYCDRLIVALAAAEFEACDPTDVKAAEHLAGPARICSVNAEDWCFVLAPFNSTEV